MIITSDAVGTGFSKLIWLLINAKRIIVLVVLYSIANLLTYYALARVEASVYSVLLQAFSSEFSFLLSVIELISLSS